MITVQTRDRVARITLDHTESGHALSLPLMQALREALRHAALDAQVNVIALTARGRHFCAGADLHWVSALVTQDASLWRDGMNGLIDLLGDLHALDKPVVAAVQGPVIGGGVALLCLCDVVLASTAFHWRLPETELGMVPSAVLPALRQRLAPAHLARAVLEPRRWSAQEALALGLVHELVPADALESAVEARLAALRRASAEANAQTKRLMRELDGHRLQGELQTVRAQIDLALANTDAPSRIAALMTRTHERPSEGQT